MRKYFIYSLQLKYSYIFRAYYMCFITYTTYIYNRQDKLSLFNFHKIIETFSYVNYNYNMEINKIKSLAFKVI